LLVRADLGDAAVGDHCDAIGAGGCAMLTG